MSNLFNTIFGNPIEDVGLGLGAAALIAGTIATAGALAPADAAAGTAVAGGGAAAAAADTGAAGTAAAAAAAADAAAETGVAGTAALDTAATAETAGAAAEEAAPVVADTAGSAAADTAGSAAATADTGAYVAPSTMPGVSATGAEDITSDAVTAPGTATQSTMPGISTNPAQTIANIPNNPVNFEQYQQDAFNATQNVNEGAKTATNWGTAVKNGSAIYGAVSAPINAAVSTAKANNNSEVSEPSASSNAVTFTPPNIPQLQQSPIYSAVFGQSAELSPLKPPPMIKPIIQPITSDRNLKTNIKSADKSLRSFLNKLNGIQ